MIGILLENINFHLFIRAIQKFIRSKLFYFYSSSEGFYRFNLKREKLRVLLPPRMKNFISFTFSEGYEFKLIGYD
jgi:hypothetical protein